MQWESGNHWYCGVKLLFNLDSCRLMTLLSVFSFPTNNDLDSSQTLHSLGLCPEAQLLSSLLRFFLDQIGFALCSLPQMVLDAALAWPGISYDSLFLLPIPAPDVYSIGAFCSIVNRYCSCAGNKQEWINWASLPLKLLLLPTITHSVTRRLSNYCSVNNELL